MTTYYYREGTLYQTKTCCNLVETWHHEARVYPDEEKHLKPQRQYDGSWRLTPRFPHDWKERWAQ